MAVATAFGWSNAVQIVLAIILAFVFGYALTLQPVLRAGVGFRRASGIAFAADTLSIAIMEAVDNVEHRARLRHRLRPGLGREPLAHRTWQRPRRDAPVPLDERAVDQVVPELAERFHALSLFRWIAQGLSLGVGTSVRITTRPKPERKPARSAAYAQAD